MVKKLQAFFHWGYQLTTLWFLYGWGNCWRITYQLLAGRAVSVRLSGFTLVCNRENTGSVIYHLLHSLTKLEKMVAEIPLTDCKLILDVGANCGHFSAYAARRFPGAVIHAFEPSIHLHPTIQQNTGRWNVQLHGEALSDKIGEADFFISGVSEQSNSLLKESVVPFANTFSTVKVKTDTLDHFVAANHLTHIDVIKLDCQGAEALILKGGEQALAITKVLLVEVTVLDPNPEEAWQRLRAHFPYHKIVNPVSTGADILFSKVPLD